MKLFKLTALSAAVFALSMPAKSDLIDDSTLELKLRTVNFDVDVADDSKDWNQVSEGIELNYKSGYFADFFGFDASYYGAIPLDDTGIDPYSGGVNNRGQLLTKDGNGYSKLGQAYLKAKVGDKKSGAYAQLGLMRGKNGGVVGSASRSTPSTYRGTLIELYPYEGWTLHGGMYDGIMQRTESSVDDLKTASGEKINEVWQVGAIIEQNNVSVDTFYMEATDYAKLFSGTLGYTMPFNDYSGMMVEGHIENYKGNGKKWDSLGGDVGTYDDEANHYTFTWGLYYQDFKARAIFGYTTADSDSGLGAMNDTLFANDYGSSPSRISYLGGNFWYDEEKVLQLEAEYDFSNAGLKGFNAKVGYIFGDEINDERDLIVATPIGADNPTVKKANLNNEHEYFIELNYAMPEDSMFNGLSFRVMKAWTEEEYEHKTDKSEYLRAYMDYSVAIF